MQTSSSCEWTSAVMSSAESGCWPAGVGQNEKKKWLSAIQEHPRAEDHASGQRQLLQVGACTVLATLARTANIDRKLAM